MEDNCFDKNYLMENHKDVYDKIYNMAFKCYDENISNRLGLIQASGYCYEKNNVPSLNRKKNKDDLSILMKYKLLNCDPKPEPEPKQRKFSLNPFATKSEPSSPNQTPRRTSIFNSFARKTSSAPTSPNNSRPSTPVSMFSRKLKKNKKSYKKSYKKNYKKNYKKKSNKKN